MGSQTSKPIEQTASVLDEKLPSLSVPSVAQPISSDGSLSKDAISAWEDEAAVNPKHQLARTILSHADISTALTSRSARISDIHVFNHVVDFKTGPVTNQKSSGRCWIFATTNVIRYGIMKSLKLKEFELSQVYIPLFDGKHHANGT